MMKKEQLLSLLWIFLTVNFIFCDVFTLMHSADLQQIITGKVGDIELTQGFLLTFAIVMEVPMLMIVLSRLLKYKINRILNIVCASLLVVVQVGSLATEDNSLHYMFFSAVEISTLMAIVSEAIRWKEPVVEFQD